MEDLQLAKQQTWEEKERLSLMYEEERKKNLASKVGRAQTLRIGVVTLQNEWSACCTIMSYLKSSIHSSF